MQTIINDWKEKVIKLQNENFEKDRIILNLRKEIFKLQMEIIDLRRENNEQSNSN